MSLLRSLANHASFYGTTGRSQSGQPNNSRHKAQHRLIVPGQSLISGRYPSELLQLQKEAFHQIARPVEMPIQCARVQTIPFGRDHGISPHPLDRIAEDCGVIAFVCQYGFARETVNQGCWLARIRKLAQVLTANAAGYPRHLQSCESWCSSRLGTYPWPRRPGLFFCGIMLMNADNAAIHHQMFQVSISSKRGH